MRCNHNLNFNEATVILYLEYERVERYYMEDENTVIIEKPMLSSEEMIAKLKEKGVKFELCTEADAIHTLQQLNNYFKLTAYRKNFPKYPDGANKGKYIDLDFAHLQELAKMDMRLRYLIIHLCLDIEHYLKIHILSFIEAEHKAEAYSIVTDYENSLTPDQLMNLHRAIKPKVNNDVYRSSLIDKHVGHYPVWAFLEIIPFSELIHFYTFVHRKYECTPCEHNQTSRCVEAQCRKVRSIERMKHMLNSVRSIRNAAAHNSCILNDLSRNASSPTAQIDMKHHLYRFVNARYAQSRLTNIRIQQIITLLYLHDVFVASDAIHDISFEAIKTLFCERFQKNKAYFDKNVLIGDTLDFLCQVVDKWVKA